METDRHDDLEEQRIETVACEAYTLRSSIVYGKHAHVSIEGHILESLQDPTLECTCPTEGCMEWNTFPGA